jgi:hypothetical protein
MGDAKKAMVWSAYWSLFVNLIFLIVGASLWAFYQTHSLPTGVGSKEVFSHFLMNYFPSPFKGLMVAALLAATMSSLDSSINAMSACLWNDIFPSNIKQMKQEAFIKIDNLIMTMAVAIPDGLETKILPHGYPFTKSQLLSLQVAKAILANPKIILVRSDFEYISTAKRTACLKVLTNPAAKWTLLFFTQKNQKNIFDNYFAITRNTLKKFASKEEVLKELAQDE